jgi:AcrR family transcriptional regulator
MPTTKRPYNSPLREQGAARTRTLILESATELFAERGYGRVTVADIAAAAGVSAKTVFASVGSKADILHTIVEQGVLTSGYEHVMREVLDLTTPQAVLRSLAHGTRLGNERQFTVHEVIRMALPVHENAADLWERATGAYRDALDRAAHHVHALCVAPMCTADEAAALLWLWFGPSGWRSLVVEQGLDWDRAEALLRHVAVATLCPEV